MSITKVAKMAGVSSSTVSRVINNYPRVAAETAEAVRRAMKTLSYTPSERRPGPKPHARRATTVGSIAFLVLGTSRSKATAGFAELLRGVSQAAMQNGLDLRFAQVADPNELPSRLLADGVGGLLLHGSAPGPAVRERIIRMPTVWLMGNRRRPEWGDQVMPDAWAVGELAARYLLDRGHRRLAYLNLDSDHWPFMVNGQAFAAVAQRAGAEVQIIDQAREAPAGYWQPHSAEAVDRLVQRYLAMDPRPTGLFVADDMQVALVQPVLQRRGVEIGPGRVDVIACNNEEPYLIGLSPRPAVVDIRIEAIGRRGVDQLVWRLAHSNVPDRFTTTIDPVVIDPHDQANRPTAQAETAATATTPESISTNEA